MVLIRKCCYGLLIEEGLASGQGNKIGKGEKIKSRRKRLCILLIRIQLVYPV